MCKLLECICNMSAHLGWNCFVSTCYEPLVLINRNDLSVRSHSSMRQPTLNVNVNDTKLTMPTFQLESVQNGYELQRFIHWNNCHETTDRKQKRLLALQLSTWVQGWTKSGVGKINLYLFSFVDWGGGGGRRRGKEWDAGGGRGRGGGGGGVPGGREVWGWEWQRRWFAGGGYNTAERRMLMRMRMSSKMRMWGWWRCEDDEDQEDE